MISPFGVVSTLSLQTAAVSVRLRSHGAQFLDRLTLGSRMQIKDMLEGKYYGQGVDGGKCIGAVDIRDVAA